VSGLTLDVPSAFAERIRQMNGAAGERWLRDLPTLVSDLSHDWQIVVGLPFGLSFNYVAEARRADGSTAVLKVGYPHHEVLSEMRALRLYAGDGVCRLFESDETRHAMLLERVNPGEMLAGLADKDDAAATRIGAAVMRRIWRPVDDPAVRSAFRPLADRFLAFERHRAAHGGVGPFPAEVFEAAGSIAHDLLASAPSEVLLHADFHHFNVLSSERDGWLAIDPKGMIGDPGYEVGPFLVNPWSRLGRTDRIELARRLDNLADELGYDRQRLRDWGIAHAVLSACWTIEDGGNDWPGAIATARTLLSI
jgi:streptomycin 6-kinase